MPRWRPRLGEEKFASTTIVFFPQSLLSAAARLTTAVVFPTPPLMETMPMILPFLDFKGVHLSEFFYDVAAVERCCFF